MADPESSAPDGGGPGVGVAAVRQNPGSPAVDTYRKRPSVIGKQARNHVSGGVTAAQRQRLRTQPEVVNDIGENKGTGTVRMNLVSTRGSVQADLAIADLAGSGVLQDAARGRAITEENRASVRIARRAVSRATGTGSGAIAKTTHRQGSRRDLGVTLVGIGFTEPQDTIARLRKRTLRRTADYSTQGRIVRARVSVVVHGHRPRYPREVDRVRESDVGECGGGVEDQCLPAP